MQIWIRTKPVATKPEASRVLEFCGTGTCRTHLEAPPSRKFSLSLYLILCSIGRDRHIILQRMETDTGARSPYLRACPGSGRAGPGWRPWARGREGVWKRTRTRGQYQGRRQDIPNQHPRGSFPSTRGTRRPHLVAADPTQAPQSRGASGPRDRPAAEHAQCEPPGKFSGTLASGVWRPRAA